MQVQVTSAMLYRTFLGSVESCDEITSWSRKEDNQTHLTLPSQPEDAEGEIFLSFMRILRFANMIISSLRNDLEHLCLFQSGNLL